MLAATLGWYRRDRAFHDLEERLLHALARDVTGMVAFLIALRLRGGDRGGGKLQKRKIY